MTLQCMRFTRVSIGFPWYGVTMHAFQTLVCTYFNGFCVFLGMGSQCMRITRLSASIKTAFAFSFVSRYNVCVSHACLHRFRRLLRFPWYCVTMHAFHTYVCIYLDGFCVFLRIALQCMHFTRLSASVKTAFAFFLVWYIGTCNSHASLHRSKRLLHFLWYCVTMHTFHMRVCFGLDGFCVFLRMALLQCMPYTRVSASVKTAFAFSLAWCHNACVSHACLHLLRQLSRFPLYGVTMHVFYTLVCIY